MILKKTIMLAFRTSLGDSSYQSFIFLTCKMVSQQDGIVKARITVER